MYQLQIGGHFATVLNFADCALRAGFHVGSDFDQTENVLAETTLAQGVLALGGLVSDLLLLDDAKTTAFANDLDKKAVVQFVGAEDKLVVS